MILFANSIYVYCILWRHYNAAIPKELIILTWSYYALVACWCRQVMAQAVVLRATSVFVIMHSGIVNGYQLLCDAHTVLEPHRGTAALFYSLSSFSTFSFYVFVTLDSPFLGGLYSLC